MNIQLLIHSLTPYLVISDVAQMTATQKMILLQKINYSLSLVWTQRNPADLMRNFSTYVEPSLKIRVQLLQGSRSFTIIHPPSSVLDEQHIGRTIVIGTDSTRNSLASTSTLEHVYLGQSGEHQATVYCDAIHLPVEAHNIQVPIKFRKTNGDLVALQYMNPKNPAKFMVGGEPTHFYLHTTLAAILGGEPRIVLKIYPSPTLSGSIEYQAKIGSPVLTFRDLDQDTVLPVSEVEAMHLINICIDAMIGTPLWKEHPRDVTAKLAEQANISRLALAERLHRRVVASPVTVGTPKGF